jgi:hypothetical protein
MGIRIRNCVGWGLDLTGLDKTVIGNHDRIESEDRFNRWRADVESYAIANNDLMEKMMLKSADKVGRATSLADMIVMDEEFGLADKALFVPIGYHKTWIRYGDLLDIFEYEAMHDHKSPDWMTPEWIEKPGTLYPFIGLMCANPNKPLGYEEFWEPCYLDRAETRDAIPKAPAHLWFLIKHLELVPQEQVADVFLRLRPTFYRYFS